MAIQASNGAKVGNYVLVRQLGVGGMAEVWLVRHQATAQLRAMKFLNAQFAGIPEVEARFQSEGESQLVHPNIVRIYEVGQEAGSSFMVMDFIDGRDLEKIMDSRRGPLTIPEAVDIGIQILAGLGFAHSNGIVHRDIKPSNVLVDEEGQAYLMDFGIAKVMRASRSVTQVNARLGTPDYMSPEQIRSSRDVDSRSDIYSFGCLFYELLTGWPPFDRNTGYESVHDIQTAHVTVPATPPVLRRNGLPVELSDITMHCLAKAKEQRPQSCKEIIVALEAYRAAAARTQPPNYATTPYTPANTPPPWETTKPEAPKAGKIGPAASQPSPLASPLPSPVPSEMYGGYGGNRESFLAPPSYPAAPPMPPQSFPHLPPPHQASQPSPLIPTPAPQAKAAVQPAFAQPSRAETVLDPPRLPVSPIQSTAEAASKPVATVGTGGLYTRPVASHAAVAKGPAKNKLILPIAVGSVLLLAALGGGTWFYLNQQKTEPQAEVKKQDAKTDGKTDVQPPASPDPKSTPKPDPNKSDPAKVIPATPKPRPDGPSDHTHDQPKIVPPPAGPTLASGTITWTGNITSPMQQFVDINLGYKSATVGSIAMQSVPDGPISITVPSGNAVVVDQPHANRSYTDFKIHVNGEGPQTVTLRWTKMALPK